jgi:hypothetical protein
MSYFTRHTSHVTGWKRAGCISACRLTALGHAFITSQQLPQHVSLVIMSISVAPVTQPRLTLCLPLPRSHRCMFATTERFEKMFSHVLPKRADGGAAGNKVVAALHPVPLNEDRWRSAASCHATCSSSAAARVIREGERLLNMRHAMTGSALAESHRQRRVR